MKNGPQMNADGHGLSRSLAGMDYQIHVAQTLKFPKGITSTGMSRGFCCALIRVHLRLSVDIHSHQYKRHSQ